MNPDRDDESFSVFPQDLETAWNHTSGLIRLTRLFARNIENRQPGVVRVEDASGDDPEQRAPLVVALNHAVVQMDGVVAALGHEFDVANCHHIVRMGGKCFTSFQRAILDKSRELLIALAHEAILILIETGIKPTGRTANGYISASDFVQCADEAISRISPSVLPRFDVWEVQTMAYQELLRVATHRGYRPQPKQLKLDVATPQPSAAVLPTVRCEVVEQVNETGLFYWKENDAIPIARTAMLALRCLAPRLGRSVRARELLKRVYGNEPPANGVKSCIDAVRAVINKVKPRDLKLEQKRPKWNGEAGERKGIEHWETRLRLVDLSSSEKTESSSDE